MIYNGSEIDEKLEMVCSLAVKLRDIGASLRSIAPMFGVSKSTLHRWWPAIEEIGRLSQMGQQTDENDEKAPVIDGELSQMGQATPNHEAAA